MWIVTFRSSLRLQSEYVGGFVLCLLMLRRAMSYNNNAGNSFLSDFSFVRFPISGRVAARVSLAEAFDIGDISVDLTLSGVDPDRLPKRLLADPLDRLGFVAEHDDLAERQEGMPGCLGKGVLDLGSVLLLSRSGRRDPGDIVFRQSWRRVTLVDDGEAEVGGGVLLGKVTFDVGGRRVSFELGGEEAGSRLGPASSCRPECDEVHSVWS